MLSMGEPLARVNVGKRAPPPLEGSLWFLPELVLSFFASSAWMGRAGVVQPSTADDLEHVVADVLAGCCSRGSWKDAPGSSWRLPAMLAAAREAPFAGIGGLAVQTIRPVQTN